MAKQPSGFVVPEGEGELSGPLTLRLPKALLERVERAAKESKNNRNDTVTWLLRRAATAHEGGESSAIDLEPSDGIVPMGEGPADQAMNVRLPERLLARIEKIAKDTKNTRTTTMIHMLRWAITRHEEAKGKAR